MFEGGRLPLIRSLFDSQNLREQQVEGSAKGRFFGEPTVFA